MAVHPVDGGPSRPDALKGRPVPSGPADGRDPDVPSRPSQKTDGRDYKEHCPVAVQYPDKVIFKIGSSTEMLVMESLADSDDVPGNMEFLRHGVVIRYCFVVE